MASKHKGWIGVDLDGTLAHYDTWRGKTHIGEPVLPMLARVKQWIAGGQEVRIFTARVSPQACRLNGDTLEQTVQPIQAWCLKHAGVILEVTHEKDMEMIQLWDDRAVQITPNTGLRADGDVATGIELEVVRDIARRQALGVAKYGTTVADNPLTQRQWAQHLYEELLDAAVYTKRMIAELEK